MVIGALLQCTSYDLAQFIVGRLVTGFGMSILLYSRVIY